MFDDSLACVATNCAVKGHDESKYGKNYDNTYQPCSLIWTRVKVPIIEIAQFLSSIHDKSNRDQEQNEWSANASSVRNHNLWVSLEHDNDDDGDDENDGPDAFDAALVIVEKEETISTLANPPLDGHYLHKVVSQSDSKNGHG
mgnify:CR=1 FL=1